MKKYIYIIAFSLCFCSIITPTFAQNSRPKIPEFYLEFLFNSGGCAVSLREPSARQLLWEAKNAAPFLINKLHHGKSDRDKSLAITYISALPISNRKKIKLLRPYVENTENEAVSSNAIVLLRNINSPKALDCLLKGVDNLNPTNTIVTSNLLDAIWYKTDVMAISHLENLLAKLDLNKPSNLYYINQINTIICDIELYGQATKENQLGMIRTRFLADNVREKSWARFKLIELKEEEIILPILQAYAAKNQGNCPLYILSMRRDLGDTTFSEEELARLERSDTWKEQQEILVLETIERVQNMDEKAWIPNDF